MRKPDVTADNRPFTDGYASQNGSVGINGNIVFQNGMSGFVDRTACRIIREILCAERNALVQSNVTADDGSFPDYDSRTMVDGEMVSDDSGGMDVDACRRMRVLGQHAGDDRDTEPVQFVGGTVI